MKKEKLINVDRLEELIEKTNEFFNSENLTVFEIRILIGEILEDFDSTKQGDLLKEVLEKTPNKK